MATRESGKRQPKDARTGGAPSGVITLRERAIHGAGGDRRRRRFGSAPTAPRERAIGGLGSGRRDPRRASDATEGRGGTPGRGPRGRIASSPLAADTRFSFRLGGHFVDAPART